ncbi:MAG: histidine phosphatase family protein [Candidatus Thorarchaeota archaeon]
MFEMMERRDRETAIYPRTLVYFVVHGEPTDWGGRLSDTGTKQIDDLCHSRIIPMLTAIYSSPDTPSVETARIMEREFGTPTIVLKDLSGYELKSGSDPARLAEQIRKWWSTDDHGHSLTSSVKRVKYTLTSIASNNVGGSIAVVVAPDVDVIFRSLVYGGEPTLKDWLDSEYASCTAYEYSRGGWSLVMPQENSFLTQPSSVQSRLPEELRRLLET